MNSMEFMKIFIASIVTLICILITFKYFTAKKYKNLPPGSSGWPIIGESIEFLHASRDGTPAKFFEKRMKKYGTSSVFKTSLLGEKMVAFCSPAGNKFLFGNENKLVAVWWPVSVSKVFGKCLLTSVGEEAKWLRKMLATFFNPDAFTRLYITTMELATRHHMDTYWKGKQELNVYKTVKLYTFELACRLFISLEDPKHIEKLAEHFDIMVKGILELPINLPGTRFYRAIKAANAIRTELFAIIKQRRVALDRKTASPSQDLLSHLLVSDENGKFLTEEEIVNNFLVLLFAGHDTSSVTITLLMKKLGDLPHVYNKVLQEQMEIAESKEGGLLQWEDIQKMKYSWYVVCEVMRLHPPVLGAFREALVDFSYGGYTIPKGCKLYWSAAWSHNDSNFYPETEKFDESRFEGVGPTPFSYVPFGGGPRMCLGKEFARLQVLLFLHNVIKRFKWDSLIPDEKIVYDPMANPIHGLPVRLHLHK